ncbi:MAG: hypothetical protein PVI26_07385 [Chitinispirillia bacterium]|jgi:hypothetical protein
MKNRLLLNQCVLYIFITLSNLLAGNIIRPDSGGVYSVGAECHIIWLSTLEADSITIEYTVNNGNDWFEIEDSIFTDTASDTMYCFWTIPTIQDSSDSCKIRLKYGITDSVLDVSDDFFSIILHQATIELVNPKKNEKNSFNLGQKLEIKWSISGSPKIENVNIEMSVDTGKTWILVASNISSQSTYSIYIPYIPYIPNSETIDGGLIKISDAADPDKYYDSTIVPFSIVNPGNPFASYQ